jgi:transcription elongation factor GreA
MPGLLRDERRAPVLVVRCARCREGAVVRRRRRRRRVLRRLLRLRPLMAEEQGEQLTHAQHEQLTAELAELEGPKRKAVIEAIATARGHGDLSENFEYHAAKNEQGLLERRISILRSRLQHAKVIDEAAAAASGVVTVGATVDLERDDGEKMTIEISSVGGVSPESPVGRALLGKAEGDEVDVEAPRGAWRARILSIRR